MKLAFTITGLTNTTLTSKAAKRAMALLEQAMRYEVRYEQTDNIAASVKAYARLNEALFVVKVNA